MPPYCTAQMVFGGAAADSPRLQAAADSPRLQAAADSPRLQAGDYEFESSYLQDAELLSTSLQNSVKS